ncbi:unnamed protein product [Amoebophrya sp. A120]|nr:unnamed protein product [Amoebophrya sp. A120]|eukprot:GSA120T00011384001.1
MLRRTAARLRHMHYETINPANGYERVPNNIHNGAVAAPMWPTKVLAHEMEKGMYLRGSGIWGPEHTAVTRLILYNRLKHWRPQREMPALEDEQDEYEMDVACMWLTSFGCVFGMFMYMRGWCVKYQTVHDAYPWNTARMDGTRGSGNVLWMLE